MAAPAAVERTTPGGLPLRDGFNTLITFEDDPDVNFWEKATTPPGMDGGDPIDTTTFWNATRRTKWPRSLFEDTNGSLTAAYDPLVKTQIISLINVNMIITVLFNDESTWAFYGYLKSFTPQECAEGEQPEAAIEFVITNTDDDFAEQAPVVVEVSGT